MAKEKSVPKSKLDQAKAAFGRKKKEVEAQGKAKAARIKARAQEDAMKTKMAIGGGLLAQNATAAGAAEIARIDPKGFAKPINYGIGLVGLIVGVASESPAGTGVGIALYGTAPAQTAIDVFKGKGLTKMSKDVVVTVTRPEKAAA